MENTKLSQHSDDESGGLMVKKRDQLTIRIEQQRSKAAAPVKATRLSRAAGEALASKVSKHSRVKKTTPHNIKRVTKPSYKAPLTARIGGLFRHDVMVSGGASLSVILCAGLFIYGQERISQMDFETAAITGADATPINAAHVASVGAAESAELEASVLSAAEPLFPREKQLKVGKGDTLLEMLADTGVSRQEAFEAVAAIRKIYDPRRLNHGQQFGVTLEASDERPDLPSLSQLTMPISGTATIELHKIEDGKFVVKKVEVPVTAHPTYTNLPISGSFYQTARKAGISPKMIMELMKGFSHDVDFQRDVQRGHTLEVVVDELRREDGSVVGTKNLRFAKLDLGRKEVAIYRHTDAKGHTAYYNEKGESLKRGLLRTPVDGARISSRYGMRKHPVLGYNKMHKGMDFAAPTGTPIYAAGDGVVEYAGRKGSFGNYVRIKHNGKYSTAYAHAHRIAKGIRKGARVRQGQVIAYVGSTGRSTGPHLHYEVLAHGKQTNPANVQKFNSGNRLAGNEMKQFKRMIGEVDAAMARAKQPSSPSTVAGKQPTAAPGA